MLPTGREETYERVWRADHPEGLSSEEGHIMGLSVLNNLEQGENRSVIVIGLLTHIVVC